VVQLFLESGALCERDTFQGERCLYNALTNRIRNLLLSYDYSKSTNPLQPYAAHVTSLLTRDRPETFDLSLSCDHGEIRVHKFILSARSPYFAKKLSQTPEIQSFRLPNTIPLESIIATIRFLYLDEVSKDLGDDDDEEIILDGIGKLSQHLESDRIFDFALRRHDRRITRQLMSDELTRGRDEIADWFEANLVANKKVVDSDKASDVKWDSNNAIFADVLLRADEIEDFEPEDETLGQPESQDTVLSIPIGPVSDMRPSGKSSRPSAKSVLFPAHKAVLIRSEYFLTMFNSGFKEAIKRDYLHIVKVDCSPEALEIVLRFLYTEKADFSLDAAIELLFVSDALFLEKLKMKAATTISSLANGISVVEDVNSRGVTESEDAVDIYEVLRAAWAVRVQRLEEFCGRFIANRLERYIDDPGFAELVQESASRVKARQETDTIELIDDIRYYLSERFRLRFEDTGLAETEDELIDGLTQAGDLIDADPEIKTILSTPQAGVVRTLDGEEVDDEFDEDARNYQILLGKIDSLLDRLKLDA
jgi:ankyrin repeat/BTB/POZ domain-containing protein 1